MLEFLEFQNQTPKEIWTVDTSVLYVYSSITNETLELNTIDSILQYTSNIEYIQLEFKSDITISQNIIINALKSAQQKISITIFNSYDINYITYLLKVFQINYNCILTDNEFIFYGTKADNELIEYNDRIAVCTCIFNGYDSLKDIPDIVHDNVDFYCFTDEISSSAFENTSKWIIDTTPYHIMDTEFDSEETKLLKMTYDENNYDSRSKYWNVIAKYYKMCLHRIPILKKYSRFIYIDGSLKLKNFDFIEDYNNAEFIMHSHPERISIQDEARAAKGFERYVRQPVIEQAVSYLENGFNESYDTNLVCSGFSYRPNNSIYNTMHLLWYYETQKWSDCCQVSAPYVHWLFNLKPVRIEGNIFENYIWPASFESKYLIYTRHSKNW